MTAWLGSRENALPQLALSSGAGLVNVLQPHTGAVQETLESVAQRTLHAESFGTSGNGADDDTPELQAAIDAGNAAGGANILCTQQAYSVDKLNLKDGVHLLAPHGENVKLLRRSNQSIIGAAAGTTKNRISGFVLDGDDDTTAAMIEFAAGSSWLAVDRCRFIKFDTGAAACTCIASATHATLGTSHVSIFKNTFDNDGATPKANYQTVLIYNPLDVQYLHNTLLECGILMTAFNTAYTTRGGDIVILGNACRGVDGSVINVRLNGANVLENVYVGGNPIYDYSPTNLKYAINVGDYQTATSGGTLRSATVIANPIRGINANACGIRVGDTGIGAAECSTVNVIGNPIDLRTAAGAINTGVTAQRGIWIADAEAVSAALNQIRGAQSFALGLSSVSGASILGNIAFECLRNASANTNEGAFYITQGVTRGVGFIGNTAMDCGAGGNHSGIASNAVASIDDITTGLNTLIDRRGSPLMKYGINIRNPATGVVHGVNNISGALTAKYSGAGIETYTPTNVTTDRGFDADTVAIAELADNLGTLIATLQNKGLIQ